MRTIYYSTPNLTHQKSNIVDLEAYRRRLAPEGSLAPRPEPGWPPEEPAEETGARWGEAPRLYVVQPPARRPRRSSRRESRAWALEQWASLGVVVMCLAFTLRVLLG